MTRSGFVAVAGRPNVGKSTLVNAIVGEKVAVTSDKPQTTRRAIRGIAGGELDGERWQLVLVDLPGVQKPRDALTERMQARVERELEECDAVLFVVNGTERIGGGDRFIAHALASSPVPVIAALNKVDRLNEDQLAAALDTVGKLEETGVSFTEIYPVSARTGAGLEPVVRTLAGLLPEGPLLYPDDVRVDQAPEITVAELVREQALRRTREEVPHSVEVEVDEIAERDDGLTTVKAVLWVETDSQRVILVGRGGNMVRDIGTAARKEIERFFGKHVFLDLTVKVRKGWRRDDGLLDRIGIDA
jgi:GTPase